MEKIEKGHLGNDII